MAGFFSHPNPTHPAYVALRDSDRPYVAEARSFVEALWERTAAYLDNNLQHDAGDSFPSRFWEMYLCDAFLAHGVGVVPRSKRIHRNKGPDLRLEDGTWVEAIVAYPGTGVDRVPETVFGEVASVPDDEISLRLLNAVDTKLKKANEYLQDGTILESDPYIIAVSLRVQDVMRHEDIIPRIVRALFPLGSETALFDGGSGLVVGTQRAYRAGITKKSGDLVSTRLFLDAVSAPISGVLFASVDELNRPPLPGPEFVTVHNPLATNRLGIGWARFGQEFSVEGDKLYVTDREMPRT